MNRFLLITAVFLTALYGCSPRVAVNKNNNVDFSKYQTYDWMESDVKAGENPLYYNQLATDNIESSVSQVMSEKGLAKNTTNPDLLVGYHFFVEDKTRTVSTPTSPLYGPYLGWGRWGYRGWVPGYWGWGGPQYVEQEYTSGTVVVDMVDAKTRKLVWRGSVQDAVTNPAQIGTKLAKQVEQIAEKFPESKS